MSEPDNIKQSLEVPIKSDNRVDKTEETDTIFKPISKKVKLDQKNKKKLKNVLPLMKLLKETKNKEESSSILSNMNNASFTSVCSCLYNALYGNMLDPNKKKQFRALFNEQKESILKMVEQKGKKGLYSKNRKQLCCDNYNCFKFLICECYPIIERSVK